MTSSSSFFINARPSPNEGKLHATGSCSGCTDWTAAGRYGEIAAHLQQTGQPIGEKDTPQISAYVLAIGLPLVTHNMRHFRRVLGLKLEDWMSADPDLFRLMQHSKAPCAPLHALQRHWQSVERFAKMACPCHFRCVPPRFGSCP